ncbi:MAG TPA: hypothetical protein VIE66_06300 [Methylocella sp.]|jgi:hypothetical protein
MTDLANIQEKLNSDDAFRQRFVADPIGVLKKEGLALTMEMEESLKSFSQKAQVSLAGLEAERTEEWGGIVI